MKLHKFPIKYIKCGAMMRSDLPLVTHFQTDQGVFLKMPCYYGDQFQSHSQNFIWLHCPTYNSTWICALAELSKNSNMTNSRWLW